MDATRSRWCTRGGSDDCPARQGFGRAGAPLPRSDPAHPRYRRALQGSIRATHQEGARPARQDHRQSVLRSVHPDPHLLRIRRKAALGRHGERGRVRQLGAKRGDARRHCEEPRGDADRHGRDPASVVGSRAVPRQPHSFERRQRGRRPARAPHPGAARSAHEPRGRDRLSRRRRIAQRHSRAGDERRGGAHGRPVPAGWRPTRACRGGQPRRGAPPRVMRPLLLQGGRVIDPSRDFDRTTDVLVQDGKIAALGAGLGSPDGVDVRDVRGKVVAPGLVDVHVHLREPGNEDVETIASGTRAAVAGGFTAVCAMPNTDPVTDNQAAVGFIVRQAARAGLARVFPIGAISVGQRGEHLSEFGEMVAAGAVAVSDDGKPVVSSHLMRTALEYARTFGVPVADHCEEPTLATGGVMHEGLVSTRLGLKGIPAAAEEIMVGRDILLAELTGGHVHLCHMSTRGSVELIRRAKEQGLRVTAEVTPHHLTLTDHACEGYDTHAKMNPPLREAADVAALRAALKQGVIDCIASDHAPHAYDAKEAAFDDAPFGIVGLETAFAVAYTELVLGGALTLPELIARMSSAPAAAFRLPGGALTPGVPADIVVLDITARWTVDPANFHSKSRNSPFAGRTLTGRPVLTLVGGAVVHEADGTTL